MLQCLTHYKRQPDNMQINEHAHSRRPETSEPLLNRTEIVASRRRGHFANACLERHLYIPAPTLQAPSPQIRHLIGTAIHTSSLPCSSLPPPFLPIMFCSPDMQRTRWTMLRANDSPILNHFRLPENGTEGKQAWRPQGCDSRG